MKKILPVVLAITFMAGCAAASVFAAIAKWAPVAKTAIDGVLTAYIPAKAPALEADLAAIVQGFDDLAVAANAANSAPTVLAKLEAVSGSLSKVEADLAPILPANDSKYINSAILIFQTTLAVYEAEVGNAPAPAVPASAVKASAISELHDANLTYIKYSDGSTYTNATYDPDYPVEYATSGQAAQAHPAATKPPKLGDFKRQFNALAKAHGHPEHQVKLSLMEKLHIK